MNESLEGSTVLDEERSAGGGEPAAVSMELGHLRYILADLHALVEQGEPGTPYYRHLIERYEARRQALLSRPALGVPEAATSAAPSMSPSAEAATPATENEAAPAPARRPIDAPVLLLWLGAFLVTVASLIFVGYSWTVLGGAAKTLIMAALTGLFLGAGWFCRQRPSLRPAGATFTLIGAVLTPLTFVAAHNFWLNGAGLGGARLGLLAALASLLLYARQALLLGGRLYPFAAPLALVAAGSFGLAAVGVPSIWWPAASALLALGLWQVGAWGLPEGLAIFRRPARWVGWGVAGGALLGVLLAAGEAATEPRAAWWAAAAALTVLAAQTALATNRHRRALLAGLALLLGTAAAGAVTAALGGQEYTFTATLTVLAAAALAAVGRARVEWRRALLPYAGLAALLAAWLSQEEPARLLGAAALAVFLLVCLRRPTWAPAPLLGGALLVAAGYGLAVVSLGRPGEALAGLLFHWLAALGVGVLAARTTEGRWLYAATALVAVGTMIGLSRPGTPAEAYAPALSLTGLMLAGIGLALAQRWPALSGRLLEGGGALGVLGVLVAASMTRSVGSGSLVLTLVLLAGLLGLMAALQRRLWLAGTASAVALLALLTQFAAWRLNDVHWYSVPVALWLFGLAGVSAWRQRRQEARWLSWAGVFVLVTPTLMLGLVAADGWRYALAAGVEALALLAVGLRWGLRAPVAGGALALSLVALRQIFDSLRSLPSWVLIGLVGLTLLGVALVLLLKREQVGRARSGLQAQWQAWR